MLSIIKIAYYADNNSIICFKQVSVNIKNLTDKSVNFNIGSWFLVSNISNNYRLIRHHKSHIGSPLFIGYG